MCSLHCSPSPHSSLLLPWAPRLARFLLFHHPPWLLRFPPRTSLHHPPTISCSIPPSTHLHPSSLHHEVHHQVQECLLHGCPHLNQVGLLILGSTIGLCIL